MPRQEKENLTFTPDEKTKRLLKNTNWGIRTINLFNKYLLHYEQTHPSKKLINALIDFNDMYRPIVKGSLQVDPFGDIPSHNEARAIKRLEIEMLKKDILNIVDKKGERKLIITNRGHKIFYKEYPLAILRKARWDGYWTLIMYDIPERIRRKRKVFREKLMGLGFGTPQQSNLVSPLKLDNDIKELIDEENLDDFAWVLRAKGVLGLTNKEVAKRSWPLNDLNHMYSELLKLLPRIKKDKSLADSWKYIFQAVRFSDPHLPQELLPKDWLGEKCFKEFKKFGPEGIIKSIVKKLFKPQLKK